MCSSASKNWHFQLQVDKFLPSSLLTLPHNTSTTLWLICGLSVRELEQGTTIHFAVRFTNSAWFRGRHLFLVKNSIEEFLGVWEEGLNNQSSLTLTCGELCPPPPSSFATYPSSGNATGAGSTTGTSSDHFPYTYLVSHVHSQPLPKCLLFISTFVRRLFGSTFCESD